MRRFAVTQTPVKKPSADADVKNSKRAYNNNDNRFKPTHHQLHMDEQRQDDQLEPIYSSSVPIRDVARKTSRKRWTIETGGEKGSGRSVLAARHDDDDDDDDSQYK